MIDQDQKAAGKSDKAYRVPLAGERFRLAGCAIVFRACFSHTLDRLVSVKCVIAKSS